MPNDMSVNVTDPPPMSGLMTFTGRSADAHSQQSLRNEIAYKTTEVRDLRAEVERLRAERDRLADTQKRIMELLNTDRADRILHDLRNVLNERALFRALADTVM